MISIETTSYAERQIDSIYTNKRVYNGKHFTQEFLNWNSEFHRYVNEIAISKQKLSSNGWYKIGAIGVLEYQCCYTNDAIVFKIVEFRFSKLPYSNKAQKSHTVVGDGGFGYKIIQSTFNQKQAILTPRGGFLTKFVFDNIIGFHHSSDDYNTVYAIGFIGDRVYAIYQNGDIRLLPLSTKEYLSKKHKYYESVKKRRILLPESRLKRIIRQAILEVVGF